MIDIINPEPKTNLEALQRYLNHTLSVFISNSIYSKKIQVKYIDTSKLANATNEVRKAYGCKS